MPNGPGVDVFRDCLYYRSPSPPRLSSGHSMTTEAPSAAKPITSRASSVPPPQGSSRDSTPTPAPPAPTTPSPVAPRQSPVPVIQPADVGAILPTSSSPQKAALPPTLLSPLERPSPQVDLRLKTTDTHKSAAVFKRFTHQPNHPTAPLGHSPTEVVHTAGGASSDPRKSATSGELSPESLRTPSKSSTTAAPAPPSSRAPSPAHGRPSSALDPNTLFNPLGVKPFRSLLNLTALHPPPQASGHGSQAPGMTRQQSLPIEEEGAEEFGDIEEVQDLLRAVISSPDDGDHLSRPRNLKKISELTLADVDPLFPVLTPPDSPSPSFCLSGGDDEWEYFHGNDPGGRPDKDSRDGPPSHFTPTNPLNDHHSASPAAASRPPSPLPDLSSQQSPARADSRPGCLGGGVWHSPSPNSGDERPSRANSSPLSSPPLSVNSEQGQSKKRARDDKAQTEQPSTKRRKKNPPSNSPPRRSQRVKPKPAPTTPPATPSPQKAQTESPSRPSESSHEETDRRSEFWSTLHVSLFTHKAPVPIPRKGCSSSWVHSALYQPKISGKKQLPDIRPFGSLL